MIAEDADDDGDNQCRYRKQGIGQIITPSVLGEAVEEENFERVSAGQ